MASDYCIEQRKIYVIYIFVYVFLLFSFYKESDGLLLFYF